MLWNWGAMVKAPDTKYNELWAPLPLFYFGRSPSVAAGSRDNVSGYAALHLHSDGQPKKAFWYVDSCQPPKVGEIIRFTGLSLQKLCDEIKCVRYMFNKIQ